MGQYYKPIIIDDKRKPIMAFYSWDYNNGLKLMEHSYIGNNFVNAVVNTMASKFPKGARLIWAGDYADEEKGTDQNLFDMVSEELHHKTKNTKCNSKLRYIVNLTKGEYIDLWCLPYIGGEFIHPLPLLTADGNGNGGGDYWGHGQKYVGSWKGDLITFHKFDSRKDAPLTDGYNKKYGIKLTEIKPDFAERWDVTSGIIDNLKMLRQMVADGDFDKDSQANFIKKMLKFFFPDITETTANKLIKDTKI